MKKVKVGGQFYNFPDDMSDQEIAQILDKHFSDVPNENNSGEGLTGWNKALYMGRMAMATDDSQQRKVFETYYPGSTFERYMRLKKETEYKNVRNRTKINVSEKEARNFLNEGWEVDNDFTIATTPDGNRYTLNRVGVSTHDWNNVGAGIGTAAAVALAARAGGAALFPLAVRAVPPSRLADVANLTTQATAASALQDLASTGDPQDINLPRAATAGGLGAGTSIVGRALTGRGAGRLANNPFYDPAAESAAQTSAKRMASNPYASNVTLFPVQLRNQGIELSDAERLGRGQLRYRVQDKFSQQNQQVRTAADRFLKDVGESVPITDAARQITTSANSVLRAERKALSNLGKNIYPPVWDAARKESVWVNTQPIETQLQAMMANRTGDSAALVSKILRELRETNVQGSKAGSNLESLHNFVTENLDNAIQASSGRLKADLSGMKAALTESMKKSSDLYQTASDAYKSASEKFKIKQGSPLGQLAGLTEDELPLVAQRVFYIKNGVPRSADEIAALRKEINSIDPKGWNNVIRFHLQSRADAFLKSNVAGAKYAKNDPAALLFALRGSSKQEEGQIAAALGPERYDNLVFLSEVLDVAGRARTTSGEAITKAMGEASRGGFSEQLRRELGSLDATRLSSVVNTATGGATENLGFTVSQKRANIIFEVMFDPATTKMRTLAEQGKWKEAAYLLSRIVTASGSKLVQTPPESEIINSMNP